MLLWLLAILEAAGGLIPLSSGSGSARGFLSLLFRPSP